MGKKRIICAGTFDILHTGHVKFLKHAKSLALNAELIVIVARDDTSEKIKDKKPMNSQEKRIRAVRALGIADEVIPGVEREKLIENLAKLKPEIIALGHDQWAQESWLKKELLKHGVKPKILRLPEYNQSAFP